jgi:hypothetical protein
MSGKFCGKYLKGTGLGNLRTLEKLGSGLTNEGQVLRGVSEWYWLGEFENFRKIGMRADK